MTEGDSTRRGFVRGVALGAITTGAAAHAQDPPKPAKPAEPAPASLVDARMALITGRFGKHPQLDAKALEEIRSEVATIVRRGEQLRKIPLENGDGPFPVFHPYHAPLD